MVKDYLELVAPAGRGGQHRGELLPARVRVAYGSWLTVNGLWFMVYGLRSNGGGLSGGLKVKVQD